MLEGDWHLLSPHMASLHNRLLILAGEAVEPGGLGSGVDALAADMEAVGQALNETSGAARAV